MNAKEKRLGYVIKLLPALAQERPPLPDYYARLRKRQPKGPSAEGTRQFRGEERR